MRNYRHPGPRRAWEVGSDPQFLTPLPGLPRAPTAPAACSKKVIFVFYLQYLSVRALPASRMNPKSTSKGPRRAQRHPKGSKDIPKREPKGPQVDPQRAPKGAKGSSKGTQSTPQRTPKEAKVTPKEVRAPKRPREVRTTRSIFQAPDQPPHADDMLFIVIYLPAARPRKVITHPPTFT